MDSDEYTKLLSQVAATLLSAGEGEAHDLNAETAQMAVESARLIVKAAREVSAKADRENTMSKNQEQVSVEEFAQFFEGAEVIENSAVVAALAEHYRAEDEAKKKELGS